MEALVLILIQPSSGGIQAWCYNGFRTETGYLVRDIIEQDDLGMKPPPPLPSLFMFISMPLLFYKLRFKGVSF